MKRTRGSIILPEEFTEGMEFLSSVFSNVQKQSGILIMGENLDGEEELPVIRLYLLKRCDLYWHVQDELQAFAFPDVLSAYQFLQELPQMSALDLLIKMNSPQTESEVRPEV